MGRHEHKWAYALEHALPAATGWLRMFIGRPGWALRLFAHRSAFFFTRKLGRKIPTPDNFIIESGHELISYWSLFVERECWASEWVEALLREPKPVVLDVGANAGLFTHLVWTKQPNARFIAFEPLPQMAQKITEWKSRTHADLLLHQAAVSDHGGTATFYASEDRDPTASLKPEGLKPIELTIPLLALDSVVPDHPILLMKVDVEGCECEVLAGGKQTISRTRFLILEAHTPEALKKIQTQLGPDWHPKRVGASDFLFTRAQARV